MLLEPTSTNVAGTFTVLETYEMEQTVCVTVSGGANMEEGENLLREAITEENLFLFRK